MNGYLHPSRGRRPQGWGASILAQIFAHTSSYIWKMSVQVQNDKGLQLVLNILAQRKGVTICINTIGMKYGG